MTVVTKSIVVDAPRDAIRPYYTNSDYTMQIYQNVYLWEPDDAWPSAGAMARIGFKATAMKVEGTSVTHEYDEQTMRHVYQVNGENVEPSHWKWIFDEKDGKTTVTVQVEYTIPGRILGPALDKLMVERSNAKLLQTSLENLKALVEGSAA